jgi:tetratricopeptide (TPR) repeat protein
LDKTNAQRIFKYFENPLYFNQEYSARASTALNSMGFYVKMLLFPHKMACYYGYNVLPIFSFTSLYALTGLSALGISVFLFFRKFKTPDLIWFGILFFTTSVSMYLNFVKPAPGIVADRFLFFSSIGFALILIQLLFTVKGKTLYPTSFAQVKPYQKAISVVVLVIFSLVIVARNKVWKDKLTLFETDSKNYPESVKLSLLMSSQTIIHLTDGSNIIKNNDKAEKIMTSKKNLMHAVEIDSSCGGCYNNLSYLLLSYENNPPLALKYLMKGYRVDSTKKELLCNIGIAHMKLNRPDSAEKYLLKAVNADPGYEFMITFDVLQSLYTATDPMKGIRFFEKAVAEQPSSETLNIFLAKLFFQVKDTANSLVYYRKALEINPGNSEVQRFIHRTERQFYTK